mmetsp:Transcript_14308/g.29595  ORF Transcript_14308/g.29595 Transcript_14308/m.29595 type:complete len:236 (+) Transcript_14308:165-872(+)
MANHERNCDFLCRYFLKILIIFVASSGVVLSVLASNSCRFLYLGPEVFPVIDSPNQNQTEGWMGIFLYETANNNNNNTTVNEIEECSVYDDLFTTERSAALLASQISAMMAPGLGSIAVVLSTIEMVCCRFYGSFIVTSALLLVASLFQSGTFAVFVTEQGSCFDEDLCKMGNAAYLSAIAIFAFCASCIILCCSPRPRPCMQNIDHELKLNIDGSNNQHENHRPEERGDERETV